MVTLAFGRFLMVREFYFQKVYFLDLYEPDLGFPRLSASSYTV